MINTKTEYIAAGGNRHPAAADWDSTTGLLAYGSDRNVAVWDPLVTSTNNLLVFCAYRLREPHTRAFLHSYAAMARM